MTSMTEKAAMKRIAIVLAGCLLFNSCVTFAGTAAGAGVGLITAEEKAPVSNKTARALIGGAIGMIVGGVIDVFIANEL